MAVPTITGVSPQLGHTSGGYLVELIGTGFQTWIIPAPTWGVSAEIYPTFEVLFGGVAATNVMVLSDTLALATVPATPIVPASPAYGEGAVDVEVRNLDGAGVPIPGESATLVDAFTYRRVQLAKSSDLTRLCRQILMDWSTQVLSNTMMTTHTDYDPETGDLLNTTGLSDLPGIALLGPETTESRMWGRNERPRVVSGGGQSRVLRVPMTVDVSFTILGVARLHIECLNLLSTIVAFFERNKYVTVQADPDDLSQGFVRYPLEFERDGQPRVDPTPSDSNVHLLSGRMAVRGFDMGTQVGFSDHMVVSRTAQITEDPGILSTNCTAEEEP